jgi:flavin-dependent dehydrogenase
MLNAAQGRNTGQNHDVANDVPDGRPFRPNAERRASQGLREGAAERRATLSSSQVTHLNRIAIIGGGPAGATAAERLARERPDGAGLHVTVFEERPDWEKPCGGGLPYKVLERYPYLLEAAQPHFVTNECEFVAGNGDAARFTMRRPLAIYSRRVLNGLLLDRAREAGAEVVADRVVGLRRIQERGGETWELRTRQGARHAADHVVIAAGGRTSLRRQLAPAFGRDDLLLTFGYYVPGSDSLLRVQFFEGFEGYAWAFPRPDHLSVGIAASAGQSSMAELKQRLQRFMERYGYDGTQAPVFSHVLPVLGHNSWRQLKLAGHGWSLIGDAAGLADPITGEGIHFAMRSGELLAEALAANAPETYPARVWRDFGRRLAFGARLTHRFYLGTFLGAPSTTRMIQLARRTTAFRHLLQDLIDGLQSYRTLAPRICWTFVRALAEMTMQRLHGPGACGTAKANSSFPAG